MNLKKDLEGEIKKMLETMGAEAPTPEELESQNKRETKLKGDTEDYNLTLLLHYYFTVCKRVILPIPKSINFSKKIKSSTHLDEFYEVIKKIEGGEPIYSYLSPKTFSKKKPKWDGLLYECGLHHVHSSPSKSRNLLFLLVTDNDAYLLDIHPHNGSHWVSGDLVEIIHNNWPELIRNFMVNDKTSLDNTQKRTLRRKAMNSHITVSDGTSYSGMGGGFTASKHPTEAIIKSSMLLKNIEDLEAALPNTTNEISSLLGIQEDELEFSLHLEIGSVYPLLYEKKSGTHLDPTPR